MLEITMQKRWETPSAFPTYALEDEYNDLVWSFQTYTHQMPSGFLPIGSDPGGNLLCIRLEDEAIFHWEHETKEKSGLIFVSRNFADFVNSLQADDGEDWYAL